jgi:glycosyltransferase involved in cell wall biosynthesis
MKDSDYRNVSFFLVSNYHTYGIQHAMRDFLKRHHAKNIVFLNHPLHGVSLSKQSILEYDNGRKKVLKINRPKLSETLSYAYDLLLSLYLGFKLKDHIDIFVGFNSMNALAGIILKVFGRVTIVINYSHSYKSSRFNNPFKNITYKCIDFVALKSDYIWGLSTTLSDLRMKQGVREEKIVLAPDGVDTTIITPGKYDIHKPYKLLFIGLINEINGLEIAIRSFPKLLLYNSSFELHVVGNGEQYMEIRKLVHTFGLDSKIHFHGILSIQKIAQLAKRMGVGIAPYKPMPNSTLLTTDPMKTKIYMAAGLPIVSTSVYATAHEIHDHILGVLIDFDQKDFIQGVIHLTQNDFYKQCRHNCLQFIHTYDWNTIYTNAFSKIIM